MVHNERTEPTTQTSTATINTTTPNIIPSSLLMTSQVLLTGPTGRTMVARALLDSGATFTLISTRVMKTLALPKSKTCITIKGVQNTTSNPSYSLTSFTISPVQRPEMTHHISAAAVPEVTCSLPLQGANSVRELPHIRELPLADPNFYSPGRIDLVLGENILDKLLLPGEVRTGPAVTPSAWRTVFGWAIRGTYTPDDVSPQGVAAVHTTITTIDQEPEQALTKFWEVEEPLQQLPTLTKAEQLVQQHYDSTHTFVPIVGKYMVTLPRKDQAPVLGESRSQALQWFRSIERSLLCRGNWEQFQAVIQSYLDLGHAQPVTQQELTTPTENCYYLPMHGVYKASSSTTKLRVVFDGSAQSASHTSLNDVLCVGPTLHPSLDRILIRFSTFQWHCLGTSVRCTGKSY